MQLYITNNDNVIYTIPQNDDNDDIALELSQIPDMTGVGETLYIAYDQHKVLFEQNYEWVAVDHTLERYDAQLFRINADDIASLEEFVALNTPADATLWQKIRRKRPQTDDFVLMIQAIIDAHKNEGISEFYLYV